MTKTSNLETAIDYQQLVEVIGDAIVVADAERRNQCMESRCRAPLRIHAG